MDPLNDLATFILGRLKQGMYAKFLTLACELFLSGLGGFLVGSSVSIGGALGLKLAPAVALLSGLAGGNMLAAICIGAAMRADKTGLMKNMRIVWPDQEAAAEMATGLQTIEKS
jgi:hypothetical protein